MGGRGCPDHCFHRQLCLSIRLWGNMGGESNYLPIELDINVLAISVFSGPYPPSFPPTVLSEAGSIVVGVAILTKILLFYTVNEIYEHYEARSSISLFQINELFSRHFRSFKLEISDSCNSRNPICCPALSNTYSNDCRYDQVLCTNKLIYGQRINGLTNSLILTITY